MAVQGRARPTTRALAVAAIVLGLAAPGCGSDATPAGGPKTTPSTEFEPGDSGAFAVADLPAGYQVDRAYVDRESDQKSISYHLNGDEDQPGWTISAATWPEDQPSFDEVFAVVEERGEEEGLKQVEVHGHRAYVGPWTSDGMVVGTQIFWEERPGFDVGISISDDTGVDPVALAESTYEISQAAFESLKVGTTGGGTPGVRVQAVTGEVDGDSYVLTAVLPEGYPLRPIDRRAGCVELTYRGETASTCDRPYAFATIDDARQAVLGGVSFAFGVFHDGSGEVLIAPIETPAGPWEPADAAVVPEAPELTWFALSFPRVCDRSAFSKGGANQGVGVPEGYPRSRCD